MSKCLFWCEDVIFPVERLRSTRDRPGKKGIYLARPGVSSRSRANIWSMTCVGFEIDHHVCRFGLVGLKARLGRIGPTGEIHHDAPPTVVLLRLDGFHDVEALAVEEEGMTTEQLFELRHRRMPRRNGLGIELIQSLLDLCGIHFHRTTPLVWVSVRGRASCRPPTPSGQQPAFHRLIGLFRCRLS